MAEAIVGPLLSKLQEVAVTEAKALAGVGGQIDSLRDKLMWLHALLHEIEQRSRHDTSRFRRVLSWQIREVALQAEDAIDQFYLEADLSASRRGWRRAARVLVTSFRTQVRVGFVLSRKIQSLNARLEEIIGNSGKYGSVYTVPGQGSFPADEGWKPSSDVPRNRHHWNWEDSERFRLIGLATEKKELKVGLKDASVKAVIYVCGDSGTGKRALLRYALEKHSIKRHFDVCISASFPTDINEESIVQQIRGMLARECSLHKRTANHDLSALRVMVLMNSPISIAKWSKVEPMLLEMAGQGSKIVVSATSEPEENIAGSIIKLRLLNETESIKLFNYAIRLRGRPSSYQQTGAMDEIRKNIMDITKGLPLAVVILAKLMITMDYSKWGTASNYIMTNNNETDPLKRILLVCIDDLPDELKSCLLYTAGFPENRVIDAKQLVRLWMAEGFLAPQHGMEGEQLGQCYLKELIYRGLLQLIHGSGTDDGEVESVAIHELIHPFFRSEVRRTAFMYVHRSGRVVAPDDTRRLALQNYDNRFLPLGDSYSKLRTAVSFCYGEMDYLEGTRHDHDEDQSLSSNNRNITTTSRRDIRIGDNEPKLDMGPLLRGSPYLRVINLEGLDVGSVLPDEIGDMVHLRYLGIRCRLLQRIPSSIGKLRSLQTMDVRGTQVRRLPRSFWQIRTLRHVLGDGLMFPTSSGSLECMHTLETVTIGCMTERRTGGVTITRGKRGLRFLHRLHVVGLNKSSLLCLQAVLKDLRCLESLSLSGDAIPIDLFASASDRLFSCLEHVASLDLKGLLELPAVNHQINKEGRYYNRCLLNLSRLVLRHTRVSQDFIDAIAKLPALAELALLVDSYTGTEVVFCAQGFSSLRVLLISGLVELKRIVGPDDTKRRMNETINATLVKMPDVGYQTHGGCPFCDSSRLFQPPNNTGEEPACASASSGNNQAQPTGKGNSSQDQEEISEEVLQTAGMNPNPVPRTTTRSGQHKDQLQLETDEAKQLSGNLRSEEEQDGKPTASEGAMVSYRGTRRRRVRRIPVRSLSNKASVGDAK